MDQDQDPDLCYVCVFEDLKSLRKDRIEREASQAYPKRASLLLPCEAFPPSLMQRSIVKYFAPSGAFRSTFLYSLYATGARNRNRLLWSSRTGYYSKKPFKRLKKKVQSQRRKTEERTRANGRERERERETDRQTDRKRFKCRVRFSVL